MIKTTVCIVGAGPGGTVTALYLAKQGISCVLVDKAAFPRHKPCADVLTSHVVRILRDLDPQLIEQLDLKPEHKSIWGTTVFSPNQKKLKVNFRGLDKQEGVPSSYSSKRIDFDYMLLQEAKKHPEITVIEECELKGSEKVADGYIVHPKGNQASIHANLLVLASGSNSPFAQKIGGLQREAQHFGLGIRGYFKGISHLEDDNCSELFFLKELLPGGLYICPMGNDYYNVNIVMRSDVAIKKKMNLKKMIYSSIERYPLLKKRFEGAELVGKLQGSPLHFATKKRPISGNHFLLVGDAAGLIDFVSANGISHAVISGRIAASHISQALAAQDFSASNLKSYDKEVYKTIKDDVRLGRMVSPLLGTNISHKALAFFLNFVIGQAGNSEMLEKILYENDVLKRPSFYYKLLFNKKQALS